jgi:endoglycosylceramidase
MSTSRTAAATRLVAVLALVALVASSCKRTTKVPPVDRSVLSSPGGSAARIEGWLKTSGTSIVDQKGQKVRFLGVDDGRMNPGSGNTPNNCDQVWGKVKDSEYRNVADFGFNVVRLGVTWSNLEPQVPVPGPNGVVTHTWNDQYLAALDQAVEGFGSRGVAVILDMHQAGWSPAFDDRRTGRCEGSGMPDWLYPVAASQRTSDAKCDFFANRPEDGVPVAPLDGFEAVWKMLADRYKDNPKVVAADMLNEPPSVCDGGQVSDFYERIGKAIRAENPNILLVFEDNAWTGYSQNGFLLPRPLSLPNAVYSWHFYPDTWEKGKAALQEHVDRAKAWNVPLWIGEFNAFNYATDAGYPSNWSDQLAELMAYMKANDVSWTLWEYGHGRNSAIVDKKGQPKQDLVKGLQQGF